MAYNCFYSQLVRFTTICTDLDRFFEHTNILYTKLVYRDYSSDILLKTYERFLNNYSQLLLNNYGEIPKIKQQISSYVDSPLPATAFEVSTPDVETSCNIKYLSLDTPDTPILFMQKGKHVTTSKACLPNGKIELERSTRFAK